MQLTAADVMTTDVVTISPDAQLESAARLMTEKHVSGLPVVEDGRLVGVLSITDIIDPDRPTSDSSTSYYVASEDPKLRELGMSTTASEVRVGDVMTPYLITIEPTATLLAASRQMLEYRVHRVLVMDGQQLLGIVSSLDLLDGFVREDDES